jgi:chromate transporter
VTGPAAGTAAEVLREFARLGVVGFGGPSAHLALFRQRFVRELGWLDEQQFLDFLGMANLLPGPTSTEVALAIGQARAGGRGLLSAGLGFIGPAVVAVLLLAAGYQQFGSRPEIGWILYGVQPVVVAIVAVAVAGLAPAALRGPATLAIAVVAVVGTLLGVDPIVVVGAAVVAGLALALGRRRMGHPSWLGAFAGLPGIDHGTSGLPGGRGSAVAAILGGLAATSLPGLFLLFLKIGLLSFGSGYVLLAFLRADLVGPGLLSDRQLLDAVAIGQVTPGPVYTAGTFIGYLLGGVAGAAVATVGIFLPAFIGVGLTHRFVPRLRRSPLAGSFLDAINAASLGLIAAVTVQLAGATLVDAITIALAAGSLIVLLRWSRAAVPLLLCGGLIGVAVHVLQLA